MWRLGGLAAMVLAACTGNDGVGGTCVEDADCSGSLLCINGSCTTPCNTDGDCGPDQVCDVGVCENSPFIRCVGGGTNCASDATCTTIGGDDFCVCNAGFDGNGAICDAIQCGNAMCEAGEDCFSCSADCGTCDASCIDGRCTLEELQLVDAATDMVIQTLAGGETINQNTTPGINIVARTRPAAVGCVSFVVEGGTLQEERVAPYAMGGDNSGDFATLAVGEGMRFLTVTPYGLSDCETNPGTSLTYTFNFLGPLTQLVRSAGEQDVEEAVGGTVVATDAVLDLGSGIVGLYFLELWLSQGDTVQSAHVQFTAAGSDTGAANVVIRADEAGRAAAPEELVNNLSDRQTTVASVNWAVPAWTDGDSGPEQRTPDLAPIIQEVLDNPNWRQAGRIFLLFRDSGTSASTRRAAAAELDLDSRPRLIMQVGP